MAPKLELAVEFRGNSQSLISAIRNASAVVGALVNDFNDVKHGVTGAMVEAGAKTRKFAEEATAITQRVGANFAQAGRNTLQALSAGSEEALEFQRNLALLGVVSGTSGAALKELEDLVLKLGATTQFTANEALQGAIELSRGGMTPLQIKAGALEAALGGAAAGIGDVGKAGEIAAVAMKQFGQSVDGPNDALSLFVNTANASATDTWKLEFALRQGALSAAEAGDSFEEFMASLGLMADLGLKGERAGTSLRAMLKDLRTPGKEAAVAIDELGLKLWDASGSFVGTRNVVKQLSESLGRLKTDEEKAQALAAFSVEGQQAMLSLVRAWDEAAKAGGNAFDNKIASVRELGSVSDIAGKLTDNAAGSLLLLQSAWSEFKIRAFAPFLEAMRPAIEGLTSFVASLAAWAKENPALASGLLGLVAAVGALLVALGAVTLALGTIIGFVASVTTLAPPIMLALKVGVTAVAAALGVTATGVAVVVAAVAAWVHVAIQLGLTWQHVFEGIAFGIKTVWGAGALLLRSLAAPFQTLYRVLTRDWEGVVALWTSLFGDWGTFAGDTLGAIIGQVQNLLTLMSQATAYFTGGPVVAEGLRAELGPAAQAARARRIAEFGPGAADPRAFLGGRAGAQAATAPPAGVNIANVNIRSTATPQQVVGEMVARLQQLSNR